jgi:ABC-type dipeptide/oligopeptide/nickel transport system ATPase component
MLELRGISAGYGDHEVLRDVDLVVPDYAVVALLGPNGAGKTTLLRVATGLLRPTAGSVYLDGVDVTRLSPHRLAERFSCSSCRATHDWVLPVALPDYSPRTCRLCVVATIVAQRHRKGKGRVAPPPVGVDQFGIMDLFDAQPMADVVVIHRPG